MEELSGLNKYKKYYTYIEPIISNPVTRSYTSLILFFLTISFFIAFAIRPTLITFVSLNKQVTEGRATNEALQKKINALSLAQTEYNSLSPAFPLVYSALPEKSKVAPFLRLMEKVATASGVTLSNMQIQTVNLLDTDNEKEEMILREINFSLSSKGQYKSLKSFAEIVRRIQRLVTIDNLGISPNREKTIDNLGFNFTAKTYFLK